MKLVNIVANSAAEALAEVHRQLGPEAIVVNVRKSSAPGLSRIWKKPLIELQAGLPVAAAAPGRAEKQRLAQLDKTVEEIRKRLAESTYQAKRRPNLSEEHRAVEIPNSAERGRRGLAASAEPEKEPDLARVLENLGILPLHAQWLADQVRERNLGQPNENLREEFVAVQDLLVEFWKKLAARARQQNTSIRILVGTPGVGKTTCICKWLTQEVLLGGQSARVWRLDTHTANTAEFLSIHAEILGVPVERIWSVESTTDGANVQFVDFPGVPADDATAIAAISEQIGGFGPAQVLLVLNAAYDLPHLLAQVKAFSRLPLAGLILTHLDEETRWSKFWNLLLGAKLPVLYLSGGQNIPGHFSPAAPQSLFDIAADQPQAVPQ